jgi:hypothetical protein
MSKTHCGGIHNVLFTMFGRLFWELVKSMSPVETAMCHPYEVAYIHKKRGAQAKEMSDEGANLRSEDTNTTEEIN